MRVGRKAANATETPDRVGAVQLNTPTTNCVCKDGNTTFTGHRAKETYVQKSALIKKNNTVADGGGGR